MSNPKTFKLIFIRILLWSIIFYSSLALIYHIRWFIPYVQTSITYIVPADKLPSVWFVVQICTNVIFLITGYLLIRLFSRYQRIGFFDRQSLKVFDGMILSCIVLAALGVIQIISDNFSELHINEWTSVESTINLLFRSFTRLLIFREPQTMYLLMAAILWAVKQFASKAIFVKNENEAFI